MYSIPMLCSFLVFVNKRDCYILHQHALSFPISPHALIHGIIVLTTPALQAVFATAVFVKGIAPLPIATLWTPDHCGDLAIRREVSRRFPDKTVRFVRVIHAAPFGPQRV